MPLQPTLIVLCPIPPELRARLSKDYNLLDERPESGSTRPEFSVAVTTSVAGIDPKMMDALPGLKLVICNGAGIDKIDMEAAKKRGIKVQHTPDAVTDDTADFGLGLMYAVTRRIVAGDRFVRSGGWKKGRAQPTRRLHTMKLGIVGLGKIGSTLAHRTSAIGMQVSYTGPRQKPDVPFTFVPNLTDLASKVDILALTCPATPETNKLIDAKVLSALGPEGYLINISRGSVVDEEALITALESDAIAGAGLDVYDNEPNIDERFMTLENAVLQPHVAAVTIETRNAMATLLADTVQSFYAQETTSNNK